MMVNDCGSLARRVDEKTDAASVPVPLSEPGESPILIICCVSSP